MPQRLPHNTRTVHLRLDDWLYGAASKGEQAFVGALVTALEDAGHRVKLHRDRRLDRLVGCWRGGLTLNHLTRAPGPNGLTFRRCYFAPFWQIERSPFRWRRDVTSQSFDPTDVPQGEARDFFVRWRQRLFPGAGEVRRDGFLYLPLQGKLLRHRSFQSCSPIKMIEQVLVRDPRPVVATLHPKERYSSRERAALADLAARDARFELSEIPMTEALARCDAVITQNSSVAFAGFLYAKRAVLFADTDFHHIAGSVWRDGEEAAFAHLEGPNPDFAAYLYWFLQCQAINAGRPDAPERIGARLRALGWPV